LKRWIEQDFYARGAPVCGVTAGKYKSSRWRGRHRQHARRVCSPDQIAAETAAATRTDRTRNGRIVSVASRAMN